MYSITTCEVCYVNFDTKDRAPRVLSCGHTFCSACLQNILSNPNLRKCPADNLAFSFYQNSLASFPLNFALLKMLEQKRNDTCKTHMGEKLKFICLTDQTKICSECAKHEDHKDHNIKKIKTLKAQGAKVKVELQQSLLNIKECELTKDKDCEQTRKVFIRTLTEQFKEIKEILVVKEFELVQQANSLFDADKKSDIEGTFAWKQQIDETIKDITHACQDENGDLMILEKKVNNNDQNIAKKRTQFLKDKSSKVHKKVLEVQNSLKEVLVSSKIAINSLELPIQELSKEIYSVQEESEQLPQEELARRQKNLKNVKFTSYFEITANRNKSFFVIMARSPQTREIEINLDEFQATKKSIIVRISRYDMLRKDPIPNALSYIFHGLPKLEEFNAIFEADNFSHDSLLWFGETIRNHSQHLKKVYLSLTKCKFAKDSMLNLCQLIFSRMISLESFSFNVDSCGVTDADLKLLAKSLKPSHKKLNLFEIQLSDNNLTSSGVDDVFKLIQGMQALENLSLSLSNLKLSDETFKLLGENVLPSLQSLHSLSLFLGGSSISDACIILILKNLPNLKYLSLHFSRTFLTDETLKMFIEEVFPRLGALESFSLSAEETKVSKENLQKIHHLSESLKKKSIARI